MSDSDYITITDGIMNLYSNEDVKKMPYDDLHNLQNIKYHLGCLNDCLFRSKEWLNKTRYRGNIEDAIMSVYETITKDEEDK